MGRIAAAGRNPKQGVLSDAPKPRAVGVFSALGFPAPSWDNVHRQTLDRTSKRPLVEALMREDYKEASGKDHSRKPPPGLERE